jgi:hypothetical protein
LHEEAELVLISNLTHLTTIAKTIIFKHQNTAMALDRCPSHHDTNQGHHLWKLFEFLLLHAWESKNLLWSTGKAPSSAILGIHSKSPTVSLFRYRELRDVLVNIVIE